MPEVEVDRNEDVAWACGCGPAMRQMAAACCGEPEPESTGSEEQEQTPRVQGGA
ncbi:MAG TPA: hypothetical protein VE646_05260 [Actinomycetota bacterium]|jgi:hypothetical protein|nr:hypothetical protein [Actinomycetota bacterium]